MPSEREEALAACLAEREQVLRGECPECGSRLTKTLDERQSGATSVEGLWHRVTCSECDYWADWCLPSEAQS